MAAPLLLDTIKCTNCCDIVGPIHILCTECATDAVHLCLQCFAGGCECGAHKRTHNYRVTVAGGGVSVFTGCSSAPPVLTPVTKDSTPSDSDANSLELASKQTSGSSTSGETKPPLAEQTYNHPWCAQEEVALLEAVERYNLGNFEDVAKLVNGRRTVADVKDHYDKYYLRGRLGQTCCRGFQRPHIVDESVDYCATAGTSSWFSPSVQDAVCKVGQDDLRLLAYMPYRDDFEKEWRNEAEELVSRLLLAPDDDDLDKAVKLCMIDMYIRTVRQRRRMKAKARDYDMVNAFFKIEKPSMARGTYVGPHAARTLKAERDMRDEWQKYSQFMTAHRFEAFIGGLMKEYRLKQRIEELQGYRKNGLTSLEEASAYNALPRSRTSSSLRISLNQGVVAGMTLKRPNANVVTSADSASRQPTEKRICAGNVSDDGKRSCPTAPASNTNDAPPVDLTTNLSPAEVVHLHKHGMHPLDYLYIKLSLVRERAQREDGVSLRTNVREDTIVAKDVVRPLLRANGWTPLFGE